MAYGWFEKKILNGSTFSLIGIVEGFEGSDYKTVFNRVTYGGNLNLTNALSPLCINFTGYMQRGKTPQKAFGNGYASLEAFFLASSVRYKLTGKVSTNIGLDYYSGSDNNIDTGISDTFNRLYGSTHIYNGFMEYFVILPIQGLMDYYGGVNANLTPKFSVDLTFHIFWMDKDFIYKSDNISKNLGAEADLTLNYTLSKEVCIQAGYSRYFKSESTDKYHKMENVEAQQAQWAYMMLTVKPQLYKTQPISESK